MAKSSGVELVPRLRFMSKERPLPVVPSANEVWGFLEAVDALPDVVMTASGYRKRAGWSHGSSSATF